jgi:nicotinamide mononucleotide transporter
MEATMTTALVVLNYQISYVELFGTLFTAWSVFLAAKNKLSTWPIGIVGVVLYMILFWQIQLYADLLEQVYYLVTGFAGWWMWSHHGKREERRVTVSSGASIAFYCAALVLGTLAMNQLVMHLHLLFPVTFPKPASYPLLDSFTTVLSFIANYLLMKRKLDNWYLWIVVDVIAVWLYGVKGVPLLSVLYFAFLINAIVGYCKWRTIVRSYAEI